MTIQQTLLFAALFLNMVACSSDNDCPDEAICECSGSFGISLEFTGDIPENLQILWDGEEVVNDCTGTRNVAYDRDGALVDLHLVSFGYTPPGTASLVVRDQKDCTVSEEELLAVNDEPVPDGPYELCTDAAIGFTID